MLLVVNITCFGAWDKAVGDSIDELADGVPRMATRLWLCLNPDRAVLALSYGTSKMETHHDQVL